MTSEYPRKDLAEFMYHDVYPVLWSCLDAAFPEFGFRQWGGYWRATNEATTRALPGAPQPKQVRVYQNRPFGLVIHGAQFIPWTNYMKVDTFVEAARRLANVAAVPFLEREFSPEEIKSAEKQERRGHLLENLLIYSWAALNSDRGSAARAFLQSKGFTAQQAEMLEFGFYTAPEDVKAALEAGGFMAEEIEASGVQAPAWSNRLVGPWRDRTGRIINEWGRRIEDEPAGSDSREEWIQQGGPAYLFQENGSKASPFGLDRIQGRDLVLVDEILDVLALRAMGFDDAVTLGDSALGDEQIQALTASRINRLTLNLNYDPRSEACQEHGETFCLRCFPGHVRTLEMLDKATATAAASFQVYVVDPCLMADMEDISEGTSPATYARREGLDAYTALFDKSTKGMFFRAENILRKHNLQSEQGKDSTVQALLQYDERVQNDKDRQELWRLASERTGFSYSYLLSLAQTRAERREREGLGSELVRLLDESRRELDEKKTTPEGLLTRLSEHLDAIKASTRVDEPEPFSTGGLLEAVKRAGEGKLSGWTALDRLGLRFHPAELAVIGSRTGHGKTTVLLSLLLNWLESYPTETFIFYSYEIPPEAILIKLASAVTRKQGGKGWTYYGIKSCLRRYEDYPMKGRKELEAAFDALRGWEERLITVYRPTWTVEDLAAHARKVADRTGGIGGVLVDYIQLVPVAPGEHERPELEALAVSRRLKLLAVDLACPVVAAAHISRATVEDVPLPRGGEFGGAQVQEAIRKRQPQLHHMRESGSEQTADLVLGLLNYRADFLQEREIADAEERSKPGRLDIVALKNRYGSLGAATLVLEAWTNTIRDPEHKREV